MPAWRGSLVPGQSRSLLGALRVRRVRGSTPLRGCGSRGRRRTSIDGACSGRLRPRARVPPHARRRGPPRRRGMPAQGARATTLRLPGAHRGAPRPPRPARQLRLVPGHRRGRRRRPPAGPCRRSRTGCPATPAWLWRTGPGIGAMAMGLRRAGTRASARRGLLSSPEMGALLCVPR